MLWFSMLLFIDVRLKRKNTTTNVFANTVDLVGVWIYSETGSTVFAFYILQVHSFQHDAIELTFY